MIAPRPRVRRWPASRQPTPSSRRRRDRAPSPPRAPPSPQTHRGDGSDAKRERVVAAVAAAKRAQQTRREASRACDDRASSSRAASAGLPPADAKQPPPPQPSPLATARPPSPRTHRGNGADAEREQTIGAVAAAEHAQQARRGVSRARDGRASSSRAASDGLTPADAKQPPPRPELRRYRAPRRHLKHTEITSPVS